MSFERAVALAGYFTAHAVWCISEGVTLIPLVGFEAGGRRQIDRFVHDEYADAVTAGRRWLAANPAGAERAALVFEGHVTLDGGRHDALVVNVVEFAPERRSLEVLVPYRAPGAPGGFAVHRPKFVGGEGLEGELDALGEAFFAGVDAHEHGARVWGEHLDQSL